ncbi:MAG: hypothetical protein ABR915_07500 [Thermoguttaceae bacterium]
MLLRRTWIVQAGAGVIFAASAAAAFGQARKVEHPLLLWTKDEAAATGQRIETDPAARRQYERMAAMESGGRGGNRSWLNLFQYAVLGDKKAGEAEKQALLRFIGARPGANKPGNPATGNLAYRDDRTLDALRYDVLYDELSPEQRRDIEATIRGYVDWLLATKGPWSKPDRPRTGWLPNMQWPTVAGIHVLAVASRDEKNIRDVFGALGGWKWYMDSYVAGDRFYMEEFGKFASNIGAMLLWCEGLERLGLPQYGYGYTGKGGANMRNFLGSLIAVAYPRLPIAGGTADFLTVNMGDAAPLYAVRGYAADGSGGSPWWAQFMMQGPIQKMQPPLWWEIGHRRFPDAGFDYFLAQLRKPGEDLYLPSLYFGLGPIDPKKARPPAASSFVTPERGFALLRAEESPAYWESPKPAVALQFGMYYVHYVHDCFSILQYVARNRLVYNKQGVVWPGYAGGDPWRDSVRGQGSGVVVDGLQIQYVDSGEEGCAHQQIRQRLGPAARFVAVRAKPQKVQRPNKEGAMEEVELALYPGVDAQRCLVLTDDYLLDVFWLQSDRPRVYDWHVQGPGQVLGADGAPWADSNELSQSPFWDPQLAKNKKPPEPANVRKKAVGEAAWTETLVQGGEGKDVFGVRVHMLGEPDTALFAFTPPGTDAKTTAVLMARRRGTATALAAVHEPFAGGAAGQKIARFERIAQSPAGLAVAVRGQPQSGIDDRVLIRFGDEYERPLTLAGNGESFTFSDSVYLRAGGDRVVVEGPLTAMKLRVSGTPKLILNGKETPAAIRDGWLELR